ncbi:hypothetical protein INT45_014031 [Circinella minor]|uniref:Uncharacterized protein n=1 Tax=Circinella minor TaxID=1195481 RepID=A0A8H7VJM6_9FUNG|nr:hypothetical protein INT45_014031 [Circinella minor]
MSSTSHPTDSSATSVYASISNKFQEYVDSLLLNTKGSLRGFANFDIHFFKTRSPPVNPDEFWSKSFAAERIKHGSDRFTKHKPNYAKLLSSSQVPLATTVTTASSSSSSLSSLLPLSMPPVTPPPTSSSGSKNIVTPVFREYVENQHKSFTKPKWALSTNTIVEDKLLEASR